MLVWTSELVSEEDDAQRIRATDWLQTVKVLALTATLLAAVDNIGWLCVSRGEAEVWRKPPKKWKREYMHRYMYKNLDRRRNQTTKKFFGDDERQNYFS